MQQPYKELVNLSSLQPVTELPEQRPVEGPGTILCSVEVETCLGRMPVLPDVTLAINGEAELLRKKPILLLAEHPEPPTAQPAKAMPDITMERKQPDGEDVLIKAVAEGEEPDPSLTANGMLDRISHDLDYLLNRTKEDA